MDVVVRPYECGDEIKIIDLLKIGFDDWPSLDLSYDPIEFWKWKYLDNPVDKASIIVAEYGDQIVGCLHGYPQRVKIGDSIHFADIGADLTVHPDFRKRGIWTAMSDLRRKYRQEMGIMLNYWISSNPIVLKSNYKQGHNMFPFNFDNIFRIKDIDKYMKYNSVENRFIKKIGFRFLNLINDIRYITKKDLKTVNDFSITEINRFSDDFDIFWDNIKNNYYFIVERSSEYLNWRYCDPRVGNYIIKKCDQNDLLVGYIVLRINKKSENTKGVIVDLLTLNERFDVLNSLLKDAILFFNSEDINLMNCRFIHSAKDRVIFRKRGFLYKNASSKILYNNEGIGSNIALSQYLTPSKFHLCMGDLCII